MRSIAPVAATQRRVFRDHHFGDVYRAAERSTHAAEYEAREVLAGRDQFAVGKFRNVQVDVPVVEAIADLEGQHAIELRDVDEHPRAGIDFAADGNLAGVRVPVIIGSGAQSKDTLIL